MLKKESEKSKARALEVIDENYDMLKALSINMFSGTITRFVKQDLIEALKYITPNRTYCISCTRSLRNVALILLNYKAENGKAKTNSKRGKGRGTKTSHRKPKNNN